MNIGNDSPFEILRLTPSYEFIFMGDAHKQVGYLSWKGGQLSFGGNLKESAKAFFQFLKPYIDEYIAEGKEINESFKEDH